MNCQSKYSRIEAEQFYKFVRLKRGNTCVVEPLDFMLQMSPLRSVPRPTSIELGPLAQFSPGSMSNKLKLNFVSLKWNDDLKDKLTGHFVTPWKWCERHSWNGCWFLLFCDKCVLVRWLKSSPGFIWHWTRIEIKARETPIWHQRYKAVMHSLPDEQPGGSWRERRMGSRWETAAVGCCGGAQHLALSHWFQLSNKLDHFSHRPAVAPLAFNLFSHLAELPVLCVKSGRTTFYILYALT